MTTKAISGGKGRGAGPGEGEARVGVRRSILFFSASSGWWARLGRVGVLAGLFLLVGLSGCGRKGAALGRARILRARGQYPAAAEEAQKYLKVHPESIEGRLLLAECYRRQYMLAEAKEEAEAVLKLDPDHTGARVELARVYLAEARRARAQRRQDREIVQFYHQAETLARRIVEKGASGEAYVVLGDIFSDRESRTEAVGYYQEATKVAPDLLPAYLGWANQLLVKGESKEAKAVLQQLLARPGQTLQQRQNRAEACRRLSGIFRRQNELEETKKWLQKALEEYPLDWLAFYGLAELALEQKKPEEALEQLRQAEVKAGRLPFIAILTARAHIAAAGQSEEAEGRERHLQSAAQDLIYAKQSRSPTQSLQARALLARVFRMQRRIDQAIAEFTEILKQDRTRWNIRLLLAELLLQEQSLPEALRECNRVLGSPEDRERMPESAIARAYHLRAQVHQGLHDLRAARIDLERASQLDPSFTWAQATLAEMFLLVGQPERARDTCLAAKSQPATQANPYIDTVLGRAYLVLGEPEKAITAFQVGLKKAPDDMSTRILLSQAYRSAKKWKLAVAELEALQKLRPDSPAPPRALARVYEQIGQPEKAADLLREALRLKPDDLLSHHALGRVLLATDQAIDAVKVLQAGLKTNPDNTRLRLALAVAEQFAGKAEEALKTLEGGVKEASEADAESLRRLRFHLRLVADQFDQAEADLKSWPDLSETSRAVWEKLLARARVSPKTVHELLRHLHLARLYQGARLPELAEPRYLRALEADPHTPVIYIDYSEFLLQRGRRDEAKKQIAAMQKEFPDLAQSWYLQAVSLVEENQAAAAREPLEKALETDPKHFGALVRLGELELYQGESGLAMDLARRATEAAPEQAAGWALLARCYLQTNQLDEAEPALEKALELQPTLTAARLDSARLALAKRQINKCIQICQAILRQDMTNWRVYEILGRAFSAAGRPREAIASYRELIQIFPNIPSAYLDLALAYSRIGRLTATRMALEQGLEANPKSKALRRGLANLHRIEGNFDAARRQLMAVFDQDPNDTAGLLVQANIYQDQDQPKKAEEIINRILEKEEDGQVTHETAPAHLFLARHHRARGELDKSLRHYDIVGRKFPRLLRPHEAAAIALAVGRFPLVEEIYTRALGTTGLSPAGRFGMLLNLAICYQVNNQLRQADDTLAKAEEAQRNLAILRTVRINRLLASQEYEEALTEAEAAAALATIGPARTRVREQFQGMIRYVQQRGLGFRLGNAFNKSIFFLQADWPERALVECEKAVEAGGPSLPPLEWKANIYRRMKRLKDEVQTLEELVQRAPKDYPSLLRLSRLYAEAQMPEKAKVTLERAAQSAPDSPQSHYQIAEAYYARDDLKSADAYYRKIPATVPEAFWVIVLSRRAAIAQASGRIDEAEEMYENVLRIAPRHTVSVAVRNNLAWLLATKEVGRELPRALVLAREAAKIAPGEGPIKDTIGYILLLMGQRRRALEEAEKIEPPYRDTAIVQYHLGLCYQANDMPKKAVTALENALAAKESPLSKKEQEDCRKQLEILLKKAPAPPGEGKAAPPGEGKAAPPEEGKAAPPEEGKAVPPEEGKAAPPEEGEAAAPAETAK